MVGVVGYEDLRADIRLETPSQNKILRAIKKNIVKQRLEMFTAI